MSRYLCCVSIALKDSLHKSYYSQSHCWFLSLDCMTWRLSFKLFGSLEKCCLLLKLPLEQNDCKLFNKPVWLFKHLYEIALGLDCDADLFRESSDCFEIKKMWFLVSVDINKASTQMKLIPVGPPHPAIQAHTIIRPFFCVLTVQCYIPQITKIKRKRKNYTKEVRKRGVCLRKLRPLDKATSRGLTSWETFHSLRFNFGPSHYIHDK